MLEPDVRFWLPCRRHWRPAHTGQAEISALESARCNADMFSKLFPLDLDRNAADPGRGNAPVRTIREVMRDHWLYWGVLGVVYVGFATFNASLLLGEIRGVTALPISMIEIVAAVVLFLRAVFDPRFRSGFDTAQRQIIAFQRRTQWRRQFFDPYWGPFSAYWGPKPYRLIQALAFFEMLGAVAFLGRGSGDLVFLLFATFFVSTQLGFLYVGLNTEPDKGLC